jgi:hypothetical protein
MNRYYIILKDGDPMSFLPRDANGITWLLAELEKGFEEIGEDSPYSIASTDNIEYC